MIAPLYGRYTLSVTHRPVDEDIIGDLPTTRDQLDQLRSQLALLPSRDGSQQLTADIERCSAALIDISWLPADADHLGPNGRREVIDRFVLAARAPLLAFADQLNVVYFNDPSRIRQIVGGS